MVLYCVVSKCCAITQYSIESSMASFADFYPEQAKSAVKRCSEVSVENFVRKCLEDWNVGIDEGKNATSTSQPAFEFHNDRKYLVIMSSLFNVPYHRRLDVELYLTNQHSRQLQARLFPRPFLMTSSPDLPTVQFLIVYSVQKWRAKAWSI